LGIDELDENVESHLNDKDQKLHTDSLHGGLSNGEINANFPVSTTSFHDD